MNRYLHKKIRKKKIKILYPVKDEDSNEQFFDKKVYKQTFKKCHESLKEMRIDQKKGSKLISSGKLFEVV